MPESTAGALCTADKLRYEELLYSCYTLPRTNEDGKTVDMDIRKYALPLSKENEEKLMRANAFLRKKSHLNNFYRYAALGINRDYTVAKYLEQKEIRSTVRFISSVHENQGDTSIVYLATEKLTPLYRMGLMPVITIGFVVDMARRLFAICKDMDAVGVTHRNITPYCIFLDEANHIKLGGFDCAVIRNADDAPLINPVVHTCHVAPDVRRGEKGSLVSDMYSIASIMACFFSGSDICENYSGELPALLPESLKEAVSLGLSMKASNLKPFRDILNKIYKEGRTLYWDIPISRLYQMRLGPGSPEIKSEEKTTENAPFSNMSFDISEMNAEEEPKSRKDRFGAVFSFAMGVFVMTCVLTCVLMACGISLS